MNEVSELQKRRADNQIWNAARDYSFTPDLKMFDEEGKAELYFNSIIGAARSNLEYSLIEPVLRSFLQYEDSAIYETLMWTGLENTVFLKEVHRRPVLASLRSEYAKDYLKTVSEDGSILTTITLGHWRRVAGEDDRLDAYSKQLLDELEFPEDITAREIAERAEALFKKWFQIRTEEIKKTRKKFQLPGAKKRNAKPKNARFGKGFTFHAQNVYGGTDTGSENEKKILATKMTPEELRIFMEGKYGKSEFSSAESARIERDLCRDNHTGCHLLFTRGEREDISTIQNGFEALSRQREELQKQQNSKFYEENICRNKTAINDLAGMIANSVLLHLMPSDVKSDSGKINSTIAWKAAKLDDSRVFLKRENDNMGDIAVDILLDASTSQKNREETISSQAYIIAESLAKCAIPCRVMSFCSMTGYTIVRTFSDYGKNSDHKKIFEYVSNGCNRDGLAIRCAHYLINKSSYSHRILIVLSDVKPNDVVRIRSRGRAEEAPYETMEGLTDTAYEVRSARADGITVLCVFTGNDEDVVSAKMVYGRDFVRINSFERLAETVGKLLLSRIGNF